MTQTQTPAQPFTPEAPPRLSYGPDMVARMQAAIRNEADKVTAAGRVQMAQLQQKIQDIDAQTRRAVAELEQAMRDILASAAPDPGAFPDKEDLADDPKKNLTAIEILHNAQDAREGVNR